MACPSYSRGLTELVRGILRLFTIQLLALLVIACSLPGRGAVSSGTTLTVAVLDVGQALAVAAVTADGHALLYDAGNSREDATQVILPFFRSHRIDRLDYLVLSHPDQDHVGGMPAVLEGISVSTYVDPVLPSTNRAYGETLRLVRDLRIRPLRAERGLVLELGAHVRAKILWPERPFILNADGEVSDNDNCVVLLLEHGAVRMLLPGDLETRGEAALVAREAEQLRAAILVVGHHGSRTSSSELFLSAVQPEVAIISVGKNNAYGHPHEATVRRLRAAGARIYRTDVHGTVVVTSDGERYTLNTQGERP